MNIDKNIPLPKRGTVKSQVEKMEVGDSVLAPSESRMSTICNAMRSCGFRIATRKSPDGWRVWRVE